MSKAKGKPATCKVKSFISFLLWETFFKFIFVGISSLSPKTLEKSDEKNTLQTFLYNRIGSVVLKMEPTKIRTFFVKRIRDFLKMQFCFSAEAEEIVA